MKINYRWLAGGVVLVAVFILGRLSVAPDGSTVGNHTRVGDGVRSASVVQGEGGEGPLGSRREKSRQLTENRRARELKVILAGFHQGYDWRDEDPFGDDSTIPSNRGRLFAWVMQSERSDFPDIMDLLKKTSDTISYEGNDDELLSVLLARWVELDPGEATQWAEEHESKRDSGEIHDMGIFLAHEALAYHPDWAISKLKTAALAKIARHKERRAAGIEDNPFGDDYLDLNLDSFYQQIAILYPAQRDTFKRLLGEEIFGYGESGWFEGMAKAAGGGGLESIAELIVDPESGKADIRAFEVIANQDWKQARKWVERYGGNYDLDATVWYSADVEDRGGVSDWYLSRSKDVDDREKRIEDVARGFGKTSERVRWLQQMEDSNEPVQRAWDTLVEGLISSGDVAGAIGYMPKVSQKKRQLYTEQMYKEVSSLNWIHTQGEPLSYFIPSSKTGQFMLNDPGYREYLTKANEGSLRKAIEFLEGIERQLDVR